MQLVPQIAPSALQASTVMCLELRTRPWGAQGPAPRASSAAWRAQRQSLRPAPPRARPGRHRIAPSPRAHRFARRARRGRSPRRERMPANLVLRAPTRALVLCGAPRARRECTRRKRASAAFRTAGHAHRASTAWGTAAPASRWRALIARPGRPADAPRCRPTRVALVATRGWWHAPQGAPRASGAGSSSSRARTAQLVFGAPRGACYRRRGQRAMRRAAQASAQARARLSATRVRRGATPPARTQRTAFHALPARPLKPRAPRNAPRVLLGGSRHRPASDCARGAPRAPCERRCTLVPIRRMRACAVPAPTRWTP